MQNSVCTMRKEDERDLLFWMEAFLLKHFFIWKKNISFKNVLHEMLRISFVIGFSLTGSLNEKKTLWYFITLHYNLQAWVHEKKLEMGKQKFQSTTFTEFKSSALLIKSFVASLVCWKVIQCNFNCISLKRNNLFVNYVLASVIKMPTKALICYSKSLAK